jgi:hypothetical protein
LRLRLTVLHQSIATRTADRSIGSRTTRATVLVECTKCDWRAAFDRGELVAAHGADGPMPDLLEHLARPGCARIGSSWDRCGVYYVEPIEADSH